MTDDCILIVPRILNQIIHDAHCLFPYQLVVFLKQSFGTVSRRCINEETLIKRLTSEKDEFDNFRYFFHRSPVVDTIFAPKRFKVSYILVGFGKRLVTARSCKYSLATNYR